MDKILILGKKEGKDPQVMLALFMLLYELLMPFILLLVAGFYCCPLIYMYLINRTYILM
jgi:hypothetical protein